MASSVRERQDYPQRRRACESAGQPPTLLDDSLPQCGHTGAESLGSTEAISAKIALASDSVWGMILAVATGAFSSVGRAIARQAMGHRFESCNAHHFSGVPDVSGGPDRSAGSRGTRCPAVGHPFSIPRARCVLLARCPGTYSPKAQSPKPKAQGSGPGAQVDHARLAGRGPVTRCADERLAGESRLQNR